MDNILFDLDGTLTDPFSGITACIRHALRGLGAESPNDQNLREWIGPPLRDSFAAFLDTHDQALLDRAVLLYRERFSTIGLYENQVYSGVPEMLAALKGAELKLFLATSKPRIFAQRILQHFALDDYFQAIHGSELDGRNAHKPELIRHLLHTEGLERDTVLMVGDRRHDIQGARHNGVAAVGVAWGYAAPGELTTAGALRVVQSPGELTGWLLNPVTNP